MATSAIFRLLVKLVRSALTPKMGGRDIGEWNCPDYVNSRTLVILIRRSWSEATERAGMTEQDVGAATVAPTYAMTTLVALSDFHGGGAFDPNLVVRSAYRIFGTLDLDALRAALNDLVVRHDALRTVLDHGGEGMLLRDGVPELIEPAVRDVDGGAVDGDAAAMAFIVEAAAVGAPADGLPPLQVQVGRLSDDDAVLVLTAHHLWSDAWSMPVLARDLAVCYQARAVGEVPPACTALSYRDVALDHHCEATQQRVRDRQPYWAQHLAAIDTPVTRRIPAESAGAVRTSEQYALEMSEGLLDQLLTASRRRRTTPFVTAMTAYLLWLYRETGSTDIAVPTITAWRTPKDYWTVGLFINALIMRADLAGGPTVAELQARVHKVCVDAYQHEVPFPRLLEVVPRLSELLAGPDICFPVFQLIQLPKGTEPASWGPKLSVTPMTLPGDVGQGLPLQYLCSLELTDRLVCRIFQDPVLFDSEEVRGHAVDFERILTRVCEESDTRIEEFVR
jgi:condensation enzyme